MLPVVEGMAQLWVGIVEAYLPVRGQLDPSRVAARVRDADAGNLGGCVLRNADFGNGLDVPAPAGEADREGAGPLHAGLGVVACDGAEAQRPGRCALLAQIDEFSGVVGAGGGAVGQVELGPVPRGTEDPAVPAAVAGEHCGVHAVAQDDLVRRAETGALQAAGDAHVSGRLFAETHPDQGDPHGGYGEENDDHRQG